jgi:ribonuclease HI
MQTVDIYIDTSIKGPARRHGSYIYKVAATDSRGVLKDVGGMEALEDTTENGLTVRALETALKRINRPCHITIWLNCPYVAAVLINGWLEKWDKNRWINSKGEPVCDIASWQSIKELLAPHECEVKLKEKHQFTSWMSWMLEEK